MATLNKTITLQKTDSQSGPTYSVEYFSSSVWYDADPSIVSLPSNGSQAVVVIDSLASNIKLTSIGVCTNEVTQSIIPPTTTSTTTTTTAAPTTTTTTSTTAGPTTTTTTSTTAEPTTTTSTTTTAGPTTTTTSTTAAPTTTTTTSTTVLGCFTYSVQNNSPVDNASIDYTDCDGNPVNDVIIPADSGTPDFCAEEGSITVNYGNVVITVEATTCTVTPTTTSTTSTTTTTTAAPLTQFITNASPETSGESACSAGLGTFRYHNGSGTYPEISDTVYLNNNVGGGTLGAGYWGLSNGTYFQTDISGFVIDVQLCPAPPVSTTTSTSTSTTSAPITTTTTTSTTVAGSGVLWSLFCPSTEAGGCAFSFIKIDGTECADTQPPDTDFVYCVKDQTLPFSNDGVWDPLGTSCTDNSCLEQ